MKKFTFTATLLLFTIFSFSQSLPYPIIFIHGLNSNDKVWNEMQNFLTVDGLNFGGQLNYCLNFNGSNSNSNTYMYPVAGADIAEFTDPNAPLESGDFYVINFDINNIGQLYPSEGGEGLNDMLSNEAAIVKQGVALKYAIAKVLQITGREKVVLMGHSMGGLCAREYLQNPSNWQPDGQHHVAKLVTTGTPHKGFTGGNFDIVTGIDSQSEAYRDLRKEYLITGNDGVYLFGGYENTATIGSTYYNNDINVNGESNDNTLITGLNQKSLFADVDYAYIMGKCGNCQALQGAFEGDGIVRTENANLDFYNIPVPRNRFLYEAYALNPFVGLHSDLPKAIIPNMQGLDEPNDYNISYGIDLNRNYKAYVTVQPENGYPADFDDYKFSIIAPQQVTVLVHNPFATEMTARIVDSAYNIISSHQMVPNVDSEFYETLVAGQYYLEVYMTANESSYLTPYSFGISNTLSVNNDNIESVTIYPNPTTSKIYIDSQKAIDKIEVFNMAGAKVLSFEMAEDLGTSAGLDLSNLSIGSYVIKLYEGENTKSIKVMKN